MIIYGSCFISTIVFTYFAEINFKKNNRKLACFCSFFAILIPTLVCGLRSVGVGRDMDVYVTPALDRARSLSFKSYMNSSVASKNESGYMIFVYVISLFTQNYNVLFFIIQLIPCICVYIFAYYHRDEIPMWMVVTTYLLTWYCRGFTVMRQSIAIGIFLISFITFEKKKKILTIFLFLLAFSFHKSVFIAGPIYFISWLCDSEKINKKSKYMISLGMFFSILVILFFYKNILFFLTNTISILPQRFYGYTNMDQFSGDDMQIDYVEILLRFILLFFILFYIFIFKKENKDKEMIKYSLIYIVSVGIYSICFEVSNAERMSYYYYYLSILYMVPALRKMFKKDRLDRMIVSVFLIVILFVYWFYQYPVRKKCETYPYRSTILNIK